MTSGTQSVMIAVVSLAAIAALARLNSLLIYRMSVANGGSDGGSPVSEASVLAIRTDIQNVRTLVAGQADDLAAVRSTVETHKLGFDQFVTGLLNEA